MVVEANRKAKPSKPRKPYPEFPLYAHRTGRWAKRIRGKIHYFGPWRDPQGSVQRYLDQKDDLHAGRTPRVSGEGGTIRDLANSFLTAKQRRRDNGELSPRTLADYLAVCERIIATFGKTRLVIDLAADDFEHLRAEMAKVRGPVALGNEVQRVRTVFKYAFESGLIDRPVRFGPGFTKPTKKTIRQARHAKGPRMFEAQEVRALIKAASAQLKAMILLGINAAFGNSDVATLPLKALDLAGAWVDFPRPKTAMPRRVPLWPETVAWLTAALKARPKPQEKANERLVFITKYGQAWGKTTSDNPITKETAKLLKSLKLQRPGLNFYALRHTFETIGGESRDQVAVDYIMGHSRDDMASVYRERISDERLKAVTDHVHGWLFPKAKAQPKRTTGRCQRRQPKTASEKAA